MVKLYLAKLWKVVLPGLVGCLVCAVVPAQAQQFSKTVTVIHESAHDVSLPLSELAKMVPVQKHANREVENHNPRVEIKHVGNGEDPVAQTVTLPTVSTTGLLNFDGQGADNLAPPDTEGAVGATQFVQWVNIEYNVYDKTTGAKTLGPIQGNALWSGFANEGCSSSNSGDPIVLYDKIAQRWFFSQPNFNGPFAFCIAVSTTSDATGTYNRYAFAVSPSSQFPDYPKWGVWADAYYLAFHMFLEGGGDGDGVQACAADRTAMLAGNTATMQCFTAGTSVQLQTFLPADLDGTTAPPTGEPNTYITLGSDTAHLNLWQFHVDFTNPSNSTFTGPNALAVPAYTLVCQSDFQDVRNCVPQPSPGEGLDAISNRLMYRNAYRNLGTYESMLVSDTVKPSSSSTAVAAVRWYEIRNPSAPTLFQSGTYQNAKYSLWMSSIAQDKMGDIALGFSASSTALDPSVAYVGRVPTDPVGKMEAPALVVKGTGVQESTDNRWGDYSTMQVDPTDDCTFWYTQEYIKKTGSFNWSTRIASFKFNSCQ
jgi:hypothetical protein